jgi:hypothetical protein
MVTEQDLTQDETGLLIAADKVAGTSVYDTDGERIGSIADVMIDKGSGRIAYAVLSFGGFLGIGALHHPLPWSILHYDRRVGGYVVKLSKELLQAAPAYGEDERVSWDDRVWGRRVHDYYGVPPYWDIMP